MTALALLVDALAAYRLTKLATDDSITEGPRAAIVHAAYAGRPLPEPYEWRQDLGRFVVVTDGVHVVPAADVVIDTDLPPKVAELVTCRWCAGMWLSAGVVAAARLAPRAWRPLARALAFSAAAALIAGLED